MTQDDIRQGPAQPQWGTQADIKITMMIAVPADEESPYFLYYTVWLRIYCFDAALWLFIRHSTCQEKISFRSTTLNNCYFTR